MDLTKTFPRSPNEKMGGLVHFPRMIDKARAFSQKTLGEYIFPCPLDKIILNFLETGAEELIQIATTQDDGQISQWIEEKCKAHNPHEIKTVNRQIIERKPDSEDRMKYFLEILNKIDPTRTEITTWVELIDLEEGRSG
ncbi:MAG: DUF5069 domain-containing protein [Nitrospinaceae bacterium]